MCSIPPCAGEGVGTGVAVGICAPFMFIPPVSVFC
jgi:hypothetical protein